MQTAKTKPPKQMWLLNGTAALTGDGTQDQTLPVFCPLPTQEIRFSSMRVENWVKHHWGGCDLYNSSLKRDVRKESLKHHHRARNETRRGSVIRKSNRQPEARRWNLLCSLILLLKWKWARCWLLSPAAAVSQDRLNVPLFKSSHFFPQDHSSPRSLAKKRLSCWKGEGTVTFPWFLQCQQWFLCWLCSYNFFITFFCLFCSTGSAVFNNNTVLKP